MRFVLGLFLIIVSFVGNIFFRRYHGSIIDNPFLWHGLFVLIGIAGIGLLYFSLKNANDEANDFRQRQMEQFLASAGKIPVDFDRCEFRSGSFTEYREDTDPIGLESLAPPAVRLFADTPSPVTVHQSYLILETDWEGQPRRFISHSFPCDVATLKFKVMNREIALYVQKANPGHYLFLFDR